MLAKMATRLVHVDSISLTKSAKRALEIATNTSDNRFIKSQFSRIKNADVGHKTTKDKLEKINKDKLDIYYIIQPSGLQCFPAVGYVTRRHLASIKFSSNIYHKFVLGNLT